MKVIAFIIEIINWIKIALSPTLIGVAIGWLIYYNYPNIVGLIIGCSLAFIGLLLGVIWATRVWKKKGTAYFMSRNQASPDIDEAIKSKIK